MNQWKRLVIRQNTKKAFYSNKAKIINEDLTDVYQAVPFYKQMSSLYISPHRLQAPQQDVNGVFPRLFQPNINLSELFKNLNCLKENLKLRNKLVDVEKLQADYLKVIEMQKCVDELTQRKISITKEIGKIIGTSKANKQDVLKSEQVQMLMETVKNLTKQIDTLNEQLHPLEEIVNVAALKLPNKLHSNVPRDERNHVVFEIEQNKEYVKQNDITSSPNHAIINRWDTVLKGDSKYSFIDFNDYNTDELFMCYMGENYAKLELAINYYFINSLQKFEANNNLEFVKGPSMFKSPIIEGGGIHFNDSRQLLNVVRFGSSNIELLHLSGSSSLYSLILNFVNKKLHKTNLPWLTYTNGKSYSPARGQRSKLNLLAICSNKSKYLLENDETDMNRTDVVDYEKLIKAELAQFKFDKNVENLFQSNDVDVMLIDLLKLMVHLYDGFNVKMRLQSVEAHALKSRQCYKVTLDAYLQSEQKYTTVAEISLLNDYISRRLQIYYFDASNTNNLDNQYVSMVHVKLIDINSFMRCLIEANIQKTTGDFILPNNLKDFMF